MTLEAERAQVLILEERLEGFENEALQKDTEKFNRINQELHQTQKRCKSEATKTFETEEQSMRLNEDLTTAQRNLKEKENLANAIAKEVDKKSEAVISLERKLLNLN